MVHKRSPKDKKGKTHTPNTHGGAWCCLSGIFCFTVLQIKLEISLVADPVTLLLYCTALKILPLGGTAIANKIISCRLIVFEMEILILELTVLLLFYSCAALQARVVSTEHADAIRCDVTYFDKVKTRLDRTLCQASVSDISSNQRLFIKSFPQKRKLALHRT